MTRKVNRFEPQGPAGRGLARWPEIPLSEIAVGKPVQRGHIYFEDKASGLSAGVWDCTTMTLLPMSYPVNEVTFVCFPLAFLTKP